MQVQVASGENVHFYTALPLFTHSLFYSLYKLKSRSRRDGSPRQRAYGARPLRPTSRGQRSRPLGATHAGRCAAPCCRYLIRRHPTAASPKPCPLRMSALDRHTRY